MFIRDGEKRIFLRNILFIRNPSSQQIVVVREWGSTSNRGAWEPPKGQMEWKEVAETGIRPNQDISVRSLQSHMRRGVLREIQEEAKILPSELRNIRLTPLNYTAPFPKAGRDAFFRYAFWEATLNNLEPAKKRMATLVGNPDWVHILPADVCEKNAVAWWSPTNPATKHWIRGAFSGEMVDMYINALLK